MNNVMRKEMKLHTTSIELAKIKATLAIIKEDSVTKEIEAEIDNAFNAVSEALKYIEIEQFKLVS